MTNKPPFAGELVKVSEVFTLQMGRTPSRKNYAYWNNGDYEWVSIKDLGTYDRYVGDTKETISELGRAESGIKPVPPDTLLMSFKLSLGKVAITTKWTYTNEAIMAFLDKGCFQFDLGYMWHQFRSKDWTRDTNSAVKGKTLNKRTLGAALIHLPELQEQKEIATHLDKVQAQIGIARNQLASLDSLVKSRFVEMFGDPCDPKDRKGGSRLDSFCELRIGPFGSALHKEDYITGGHPLVNPSHIVNGAIRPDRRLTINEEKYESLAAYHLHLGDVVLGRRGEIGRCAVVDKNGMICGTGSMILRPGQKVRSSYLQRVVSFPSFSRALEGKAVGVTMKNLNAKIVGSTEVYLPKLVEQDAFIDFAAEVDKSRVVVQKQIERLQTLYDSLAQEYFG